MIKSKIARIFEKLCFIKAAGDCILLLFQQPGSKR